MTEREKRNLIPEENLYTELELLVYGHFHEDEDDLGFKATRWVAWSEVEQVPSDEDGGGGAEAFDMLTSFVDDAKSLLHPES